MGEVPAYANPLIICLPSGSGASRILISVGQMLVHEIDNGLHTLPPGRDMAEMIPGFLAEEIGLAITASHEIDKDVRGQIPNFMLDCRWTLAIVQAAIGNGEVT